MSSRCASVDATVRTSGVPRTTAPISMTPFGGVDPHQRQHPARPPTHEHGVRRPWPGRRPSPATRPATASRPSGRSHRQVGPVRVVGAGPGVSEVVDVAGGSGSSTHARPASVAPVGHGPRPPTRTGSPTGRADAAPAPRRAGAPSSGDGALGRSNQRRCSKSAGRPAGCDARSGGVAAARIAAPSRRCCASRSSPPRASARGTTIDPSSAYSTSPSRIGGSTDPVAVPPAAGERVEEVVTEQPPAVARDEAHGLHDVVGDGVGEEVVEVHPHPAGLDALAAAGDLALELVRALEVDAEQPVAVGAGARAPAAGLHAEQVVEHGDDEVVVQPVPRRRPHHERDDRQPRGLEVAEDLDGRLLPATPSPPGRAAAPRAPGSSRPRRPP